MSIGFGLERLGRLTLKFPRVMAALVIAFTALCVWQLPGMKVDADLLRVYKNSGEYYQRYEDLRENFGTFENDTYILVSTPKLTDPAVLEKLREMSLDLALNDFAVGTMSPFSLRKPAENNETRPAVPEGMTTPEEIAKALSDLRETDPLMKNLIAKDLSGVVMIMFPDYELTRGDGELRMIESVRELASKYEGPDITIEVTGPPIWKTEMLDASISDQVKFSLYGFIIGTIMSLFALRSVWAAVLATLTPGIAVIWVSGVVMMMFGSFTFLTNIVTTLVLVIAFAESMYFMFTWMRLSKEGMDPMEAIRETVERVMPAAALTTITTMVSFSSLIFTQGQGIEEFGVSGVVGVAVTFLALATFTPLVLMAAVKLGFRQKGDFSIAVTAPIPASRFLAMKHARLVSIVALIGMVGMVYVHFDLKPRFSFSDFLPSNAQSLDTAAGIDEDVGGVAPIYIRIPLKDGVENVTDADFAKIEQIHKIFESEIGAGKVISAASFTHYSDSGFTREQIFNAVGPFLKRRFVTDDGKQALITGFMPTLLDSDHLREVVENTDRKLQEAGINDARVAGFQVLTAFASTDIIASLRNGLTAAVIINIFVIGLAFRSWRAALVSVIPNFLPILGTELYLWTSGAGLQLTTVIALTIAFGIAVDDTIHYLATYKRQRENGLPHLEAVDMSLERIGPALVATTLILCAGSFIVVFSALPQVALFGTLTVLTLFLALLGDLIVLPALLVAGGRFFDTLFKAQGGQTK